MKRRRGAVYVVGFASFLILMVAGRAALGWAEAIYFATGIVVLWYTIETWKLRREMQRQTNLQVRPFLSISFRGVGMERRALVQNLGLGLARSVRVSDVRLTPSVKLQGGFLTHLPRGAEEPIPCRVFIRLRDGDPFGELPLKDRDWTVAANLSTGRHQVTFTYASLAGAWYETTLQLADGTVHIAVDEEIGVPAAERGDLRGQEGL